MDEKQRGTIIFGIGVIVLLVIIGMNCFNIDYKVNSALSDLNTLKNNDLAMVKYIQANSTTMEYLNKNCKQTADTNDTITLTCFKVKQ